MELTTLFYHPPTTTFLPKRTTPAHQAVCCASLHSFYCPAIAVTVRKREDCSSQGRRYIPAKNPALRSDALLTCPSMAMPKNFRQPAHMHPHQSLQHRSAHRRLAPPSVKATRYLRRYQALS